MKAPSTVCQRTEINLFAASFISHFTRLQNAISATKLRERAQFPDPRQSTPREYGQAGASRLNIRLIVASRNTARLLEINRS